MIHDIAMQVDYCIKAISDIGKFYSNADVSIKREILGLIFPESIIYSDNKVRTIRMNEEVKLLCPSIGTYEIKKRGRRHEKLLSSSKVIPAGLEPTTTRTGIWHSIQLNYGTMKAGVCSVDTYIPKSHMDFALQIKKKIAFGIVCSSA